MKWDQRKGRRPTSRSRVRFANERQRSTSRTRSNRSRQKLSVSRDSLFGFYLLIFCGPLLLVAAGAVAIFAHDVAIPSLVQFVAESVVYGVAEIWERPTLILALMFVLSLIWCFSDSTTSTQRGTHNFRRGRDLGGFDHAQRMSQRYSERRRSASERSR